MTTTEMLRKSKLDIYGLGCPHDKFIECVERFAELVRADERARLHPKRVKEDDYCQGDERYYANE